MAEKFSQKAQDVMNERFNHDTLISLATMDGNTPCVRIVNSYYENGVFYVITHGLSNKMQQIHKNPAVAICSEWFSAHGSGENMGYVCAEKNKELASKLRQAFSQWYSNGDINEEDTNTCILCIHLTDGVLFSHGTRFDIDFT